MELELELELKITELELELNWKNGIDPNPGLKVVEIEATPECIFIIVIFVSQKRTSYMCIAVFTPDIFQNGVLAPYGTHQKQLFKVHVL